MMRLCLLPSALTPNNLVPLVVLFQTALSLTSNIHGVVVVQDACTLAFPSIQLIWLSFCSPNGNGLN